MRIVLVLLCLILPGIAATTGDVVAPSDAWKRAEAGDLTIIDVRTPPEWAWTGTARTAHRANWWQISGPDGFLKDILRITGGDRDVAIALICARGVRSSAAARFLVQQGFSNVSDIGEGMLGSADGPGWLERDLPLD
ncbi:rhodanese-like domain-containing protein [Minwuia sp.]|uniref:rhodanese-like domain-containing protein n=1 Tax=Minwuia sp. TaxID=2493630 RepID=UPI003A8EE063